MANEFYYEKFLSFLRNHNLYNENILNYWKKNQLSFDYRDEEKRGLIGCYYLQEKNRIRGIKLIIPYIVDDKTILINIHEYIHLVLVYPHLNKKYQLGKDIEILPIYYEKIFIKENKTKELEEYEKYLDDIILKNDQEEYLIALNYSKQLLEEKEKNIYKTEKELKRLLKKRINDNNK